MIDFINKVGQRKFAKWITIFSFVTAVIGFYMKFGLNSFTTFAPYFGIFLLTAPHWFLALAANKSKEFRLFTIFSSILIVVLNFLLFFMSISSFLFIVTIIENILTLGFLVYVNIKYKNQKKVNKKESSKSSINTEKNIEKEENENN